MNMDIAEGKWKQLKGDIQREWGELTDGDLAQVKGNREKFIGLLQEKYGKARKEAEKEFDKLRDSAS